MQSKAPRILHIDMPRALSTTLQGFDFRSANEFYTRGIFYDQIDFSLLFWKYCLNLKGFELADLCSQSLELTQIIELDNHLGSLTSDLGCPLTPFGISFGLEITSSEAALKMIENEKLRDFLSAFLETIIPSLDLQDNTLEVISIGVTSSCALVVGAIFAEVVRNRTLKKVKIILGKHSYENFSLNILFPTGLTKDFFLFKFFDSVILFEEFYVQEIAQIFLLGKRDSSTKSASSFLVKSKLDLLRSTRYSCGVIVEASNCVISMPLSRNKCYWKKCTFCVQINKHYSDNFYEDLSELQFAFEEIEALHEVGFRYIQFTDEAVSPRILKKFVEGLDSANLLLRWTVRIIADKNFNGELISDMARLGCSEVLFGLETISQDTARSMDKVSQNSTQEAIRELILAFTRENIGVFLNLIYDYPMETTNEFKRTFDFSKDLAERSELVTTQYNKFSLFVGTRIFKDPKRFGIYSIELADNAEDLRIAYDYIDTYGRSSKSQINFEYFAASLRCSKRQFDRLVDRFGMSFLLLVFQLNYASFGFMYKDRHGRELTTILKSEIQQVE